MYVLEYLGVDSGLVGRMLYVSIWLATLIDTTQEYKYIQGTPYTTWGPVCACVRELSGFRKEEATKVDEDWKEEEQKSYPRPNSSETKEGIIGV